MDEGDKVLAETYLYFQEDMSLDEMLDFLMKNSFIETSNTPLSLIQEATERVRGSQELGDFIKVDGDSEKKESTATTKSLICITLVCI